MKPLAALFAAVLCAAAPAVHAQSGAGYEAAVAGWSRYQDVAGWLEGNFSFDRGRLDTILQRTRQNGPAGLLARAADGTFALRSGYCTDAAAFAIQSLNRINPGYRARYVFIKNRYGQPHHWVAGFMDGDKLMVMDYGAGPEWSAMRGVHGPYASLDDYAAFLGSLRIARFAPESVEWRDTFPGQQD
ncbi:hypothetical protein [Azoarcus olearius]|uniref:Hypothetical secreted protein n=1 Tax=Azoarcus sp. (strain BH72) TaxID=418699 RepID=A1K2L3_AZOSB|nr:hypothetical protein [Azoarcus olearius]ANQ83538.1 hypothetical protein dqs_0462 [Azoarcus olearius]CAL93068.1 hypothetical secreted protein [Azoarcus olearius]